MTKTVKKLPSISIKTVGYSAKELRKLVEETNEAIFIARIGGVVAEAFSGMSKNGEWTGFKGIFTLATKDGDAYSSTTCFLPGNITKKLVDQLSQGVVEIEFLADISVAASEKVAAGYAFMCEPLLSDDAGKKAQLISDRVLNSKLPLAIAAPSKKKTA